MQKNFLFISCALLTVFGVTGCATVDATTIPLVPTNYRELVLARAAAKPIEQKIVRAEISAPGLWENNIISDASRRIVCTRTTIDGIFGEQIFTVGYKFLNGQIEDVFYPEQANPAAGGLLGAAILNGVTCGKLEYEPFPELIRLSKKA